MSQKVTIQTVDNLNIDQFVTCILDELSYDIRVEKEGFFPQVQINEDFISLKRSFTIDKKKEIRSMVEYKPPHGVNQCIKLAA